MWIPTGQPARYAAAISGIDELRFATRLPESRTTLYALSVESPRKIVALHGARGLAGSLTLTGEEPSPVRMTVGNAASIRGRAVDKSGDSITDAACEIFSEATYQLFEFENSGRPQITSDKEGRFRIGNMVPGERFELRIRLDGKILYAKLANVQQMLKPGQELDLVDIVFAPQGQQPPQQNEPAKASRDASQRSPCERGPIANHPWPGR